MKTVRATTPKTYWLKDAVVCLPTWEVTNVGIYRGQRYYEVEGRGGKFGMSVVSLISPIAKGQILKRPCPYRRDWQHHDDGECPDYTEGQQQRVVVKVELRQAIDIAEHNRQTDLLEFLDTIEPWAYLIYATIRETL